MNAPFQARPHVRLRVLATALALAFPVLALADVLRPDAPRALPADGPVAVAWEDPATFQELRFSGNRFEARRGDWVTDIAEHIRKRATAALPPDATLEVRITDIQRAGQYEPGQGDWRDSVRIIRDIHAPRITLTFALHDAGGQLMASGDRLLRDASFLRRGGMLASETDPLRYEKRLVDDWVRAEFGPPVKR